MFKGLGNNQRRTYAGISNGKVIIRGKDQEPITYDHIEGYVKEIKKSDREINGRATTLIDIVFDDGNGDEAQLSLYADSGSTRTLLLALGSIQDFKEKVRINAFPKESANGTIYTNVAVRVNGQKVPWCVEPDQIPKTEKEIYKGQEIVDASARNAFFDGLLEKIQAKLSDDLCNGAPVYEPEGEPEPDMPEM